ncbi:GIY-YIG nuclease family protein [uncultured Variovorax sp.]|jgi:hypothetical protein|uniref:GIY-YIG nuclease family protein n=1 Tax=uncultured Variovorax sp. TaxID=114708 RepID=UPI0026036FB1|nr:GIY-YIG nuclease family protein [uncultured Variovorax sp.]
MTPDLWALKPANGATEFAATMDAFRVYRDACYGALHANAATWHTNEREILVWIVAAFQQGIPVSDLAASYLRYEAHAANFPKPVWKYETRNDVWASLDVGQRGDESVKKRLSAVRRIVRHENIKLGFGDTQGVYVGFFKNAPECLKVGCTANLTVRKKQHGRDFHPVLWLAFGGEKLESACLNALESYRVPELGRERFRVSIAACLLAVLDQAERYLNNLCASDGRLSELLDDGIKTTSLHRHSVPMLFASLQR